MGHPLGDCRQFGVALGVPYRNRRRSARLRGEWRLRCGNRDERKLLLLPDVRPLALIERALHTTRQAFRKTGERSGAGRRPDGTPAVRLRAAHSLCAGRRRRSAGTSVGCLRHRRRWSEAQRRGPKVPGAVGGLQRGGRLPRRMRRRRECGRRPRRPGLPIVGAPNKSVDCDGGQPRHQRAHRSERSPIQCDRLQETLVRQQVRGRLLSRGKGRHCPLGQLPAGIFQGQPGTGAAGPHHRLHPQGDSNVAAVRVQAHPARRTTARFLRRATSKALPHYVARTFGWGKVMHAVR